MQTVIDVQHVSMKFNLMEEKVDTLKEYVVRLLKGKLLYNEFLALKDVSFTVQKGDIVGIVGFNGAGKSTMLKLLAGVLTPSEGKIRTVGTIAPLIEVGAGLRPGTHSPRKYFPERGNPGLQPQIPRVEV